MSSTFTGRFDPTAYRSTFFRSLSCELAKLNTRSVLLTASIGITLFALLFLLIPTQFLAADGPGIVVGGWSFFTIFFIIIGALATTTEYAHNTMRTTALSDPHRARAFAAKILAVAGVSLVLATAFLGASVAVVSIRLNDFLLDSKAVAPFLTFVAIQAIVGVLSAAIGYVLRSTAGTISFMVGFIFFSNLVNIIPRPFFQKILSQFMPIHLGRVALDGDLIQNVSDPIVTSSGIALALLAAYALVGVLTGLLAFTKRDI
ncbi:hypothetical protein V3M63_01325 [Trueperella pyogenes]|uniref:hypothetical protein n=1 Tax=Trueperella pyogenes TaxID=1661 RepID=UPI00345C9A8E